MQKKLDAQNSYKGQSELIILIEKKGKKKKE
jgi:hypothetical protein